MSTKNKLIIRAFGLIAAITISVVLYYIMASPPKATIAPSAPGVKYYILEDADTFNRLYGFKYRLLEAQVISAETDDTIREGEGHSIERTRNGTRNHFRWKAKGSWLIIMGQLFDESMDKYRADRIWDITFKYKDLLDSKPPYVVRDFCDWGTDYLRPYITEVEEVAQDDLIFLLEDIETRTLLFVYPPGRGGFDVPYHHGKNITSCAESEKEYGGRAPK